MKEIIFPVCLLFSLTAAAQPERMKAYGHEPVEIIHWGIEFSGNDQYYGNPKEDEHPNHCLFNRFMFNDCYCKAKKEAEAGGFITDRSYKAPAFTTRSSVLRIEPDNVEWIELRDPGRWWWQVRHYTHEEIMKLCYEE